MKLSVDDFSLTFGQSPEELILLYDREQNVNVTDLDNVQIMTKSSWEAKRFGSRPSEEQMTAVQSLRGRGSWCFRESVHHHSNQWNMIQKFKGKRQEGRVESLQRSKEQNQPQTMKKHALSTEVTR